MNENKIPIPGRIYNAAVGGHVAGTEDIIDDNKNKTQQEINTETDNRIQNLESTVGEGGSIDERIATAKSEIKGSATSACDTLGEAEALISAEKTRAQVAEADRYTKSETYTKEEVNGLITTPDQDFVSVEATAQTTSIADVLPITGETDTIYRVGNWDGTQYNDSVFSEYAWNGVGYVKLSVKSQIGEVYDISANHADTKYADLAAALGTNGENIPQSLRKGGMSVKFVQNYDNKYVQSRCMAQSFTTDVTQWQGVDEEPIAVSRNLVESGGVKNVFNKILANYTNGYKYNSSMQLVEDDNWGISDYIPVNGGQTITFYQGVAIAESMRLIAFNADKTVKGGFVAQAAPRTVTLEAGTAFVILSCYLPTNDKAYIKDSSNNIIWERNDSYNEKIKEGDSLFAYFTSKACPTFDVLSGSIQITLPAGKDLRIKNSANNRTYSYSCSVSDVYNVGNAHNLVYNIKTGAISIIDYSEGTEDYILLAGVSGGTFSGLLLPFVMPSIRERIAKLFVAIGQWVHFSDGGTPKITRSGDNIYVVFPNNVNMTVYTATANTIYRHLCTGESFTIGSYQSLLYNTENDTISVVGGNGNNENNILLLGNSHGCIEGHLVKFYYGDFYDNVRDNAFNSAYLDEDIDAKSKAFCALLKGTNDIDTLTFFTDPHLLGSDSTFTDAQKSRFKKFIATLEKYHKSNPLSFVLSGGDWLNSKDTQDIACWKLGYVDGVMRNKFAEYLPVVGNHDTNYWGYINSESTSYDGELTTETIRNLWFRKEGKCYYNYKTKTTSYFVLDTGSEETTVTPYRWEQIDWLANKLLNNTDAHLVVVMHIYSTASSSADWSSHIFPMASSVQSLLTAFNARQSITLNGHTYDFSVGGISGKVACIVAGHTHFDYIDTNGSVPVFCTTNMAETSVPTFDMILLDYTGNKLKAIRVGRGDNREMNLA